jgi:nephrocystin-3
MANDTQDKRELRVFLSSTFRDMQDERDYLIKHIFPEIRQACRERLVEFTEIDLRWGVTKEEAEQGKVVRICLEEIDRCRPYFMSFLGERYGWSPVDSDIEYKHELVTQFPVVEESLLAKKSVTEMEILHGVLNNRAMADHSFFYFRAPELTNSLGQKSGNLADYLEGDEVGKTKLIQLKNRIRASGLPLCENYPSVEELGERIKQDLLSVLDKRYPKDKVPTPLEAERLGHETYAEDRCKAYIPNPADSEALNQNIQSPQDKPLIISGVSGLGKSALLAYWLTQYRVHHPNHFIIQHYAGISGDANSIAILRRIMAEIKQRTQDAEELPVKSEDAIKDFPLWLAKVRQNDPLLLILDGLNQIEADNLNWLPSFWPANVRLIVSTLPGEVLTELQYRGWNTWLVQPMDDARRNQFIKTYLQNYRKALSTEQMGKLANAPQCGNPLFLRTVLEELRVFGVFEQLDTRIADYLQANDPEELFTKVLARMEHDYGETTVSSGMRAIWAARRGLSETELLGITGISRLDTSIFLLALDYHLARRSGLLSFFHDYLRQAVKNRYLPTEAEQQSAHLKLANYFDRQALDVRKAEELPWQWQQVEAWEKLKDCISDIPMFETLYNKSKYELLGYWLRMGNLYDLGECYPQSFTEWESRQSTSEREQTYRYMNSLGMFLGFCAKYTEAALFFRRTLDILEMNFSPENPNMAINLNNLGTVLIEMGDYAAAEPLVHRALAIYEKVFGSDHPETHDLRKALEAIHRKISITQRNASDPTTEQLH